MASREEYFNLAMKAFFIEDNGTESQYKEVFTFLCDYLYNALGIHFLYRYRPDNKWDRDHALFESDKIWFQPMSKQIDQLEFSFDMDCYDPLTPFFALCPSLEPLQVATNFLQQQFEDYKNKCSIACFSDLYDNNDLWSDYANSDHGYCIRYPALDILSRFQCFLLPVIYQNEIPTLSEAIVDVGNDSKLLPYRVVYKRISTKLMRWSNEREWRVIQTLNSNEGSGEALQFPKPDAVYLGYKAKEPLESNIKKICQKKHIAVFKMEKDDATGKLNPKQIQG